MAKTVIITGGGSGIGKATATKFAKGNYNVIIMGRSKKALMNTTKEIKQNIAWQQVDVSKRKEVTTAIKAIVKQYGTIDILVNNAGTSGGFITSDPIAEAEIIWNNILETNLKGSFLMAMAIAPHLSRPGGRIINISSIAAQMGGSRAGAMAYAAAKAGIHGLTFSLARELGPEGITANVIAPGLITNTMFFGSRSLPQERIDQTISQTPMRRTGQPIDIAEAIYFLASDKASFITGEIFNVNGGWLFGR